MAAQHGAAAGLELGEIERLDQIVVGAEVEHAHAVRDLGARGQHDHRSFRAVRPQLLQEAAAVTVGGQHYVEEYQVVRRACDAILRGGQIGGVIDRVAVERQPVHHGAGQLGVIFDEQEAHPLLPPAAHDRSVSALHV